jgi:hypothetical protein
MKVSLMKPQQQQVKAVMQAEPEIMKCHQNPDFLGIVVVSILSLRVSVNLDTRGTSCAQKLYNNSLSGHLH